MLEVVCGLYQHQPGSGAGWNQFVARDVNSDQCMAAWQTRHQHQTKIYTASHEESGRENVKGVRKLSYFFIPDIRCNKTYLDRQIS